MDNEKKILWITGIIILVLIIYLRSNININQQQTFSVGTEPLPGGTGRYTAETSNIHKIAPNIFSATLFCADGSCCGDYECAGECMDCPGGGSLCCESEGAILSPHSCDGDCIFPQRDYCKQSDPSWCCDDHSLEPCSDDADVCGTADWCENWRNGDKSCSGGKCCPTAGWIVDYTANMCCSPDTPYYTGSGCSCNQNYKTICGATCNADFTSLLYTSDNYYTRLSECGVFRWGACSSPQRYDRQTKCEGFSTSECTEQQKFIGKYEDKGAVVGNCGVECTGEDCNGLIPTLCVNYEKVDTEMVIGKCGVECFTDKCDGSILYKCQSNKKYDMGSRAIGECGVECFENSCDGRDYIVCENYIEVNKGIVAGRCGVECVGSNKNLGYTCVNNIWVNEQDYLSGNYEGTENYYRFKDGSCTLIKLSADKLTDYDYLNLEDCQSNLKGTVTYTQSGEVIKINKTIVQPVEPKEPFDMTKIYTPAFILVIAGTLAFYLWRKYGKK